LFKIFFIFFSNSSFGFDLFFNFLSYYHGMHHD